MIETPAGQLDGVAQGNRPPGHVWMSSLYNRFAGQRLDPVQALSDGVFAVAMTLLVLDLRVPLGIGDSNQALWRALAELGPSLAAYVLSFTLLDLCARSDRNLTWLQVGYLFVVTLLPFSASVLAEHVTIALAVGLYWLNIFLLGIALAASSGHMARATLVDEANFPKLRVFRRRILVAQLAYGIAALTCLLNTYVSVAALAVVQLYFIVSPRVPGLDRVLQPGDDEP